MGYLIETDGLKAARAELDAVTSAEIELGRRVNERIHADFLAAGGCKTCRGRGWVVTWDTLDSLSGCYAEYGSCPEGESCTAAETGPDASSWSKYDRNRGTKTSVTLNAAERAEKALLDVRRANAEAGLLAAEAGAYVAKGAHLRVVKGRKVPRGTEGEVVWSGPDRFRGAPRVGIKDRTGEVHWTALSNCELIEAAPSTGDYTHHPREESRKGSALEAIRS